MTAREGKRKRARARERDREGERGKVRERKRQGERDKEREREREREWNVPVASGDAYLTLMAFAPSTAAPPPIAATPLTPPNAAPPLPPACRAFPLSFTAGGFGGSTFPPYGLTPVGCGAIGGAVSCTGNKKRVVKGQLYTVCT